MQELIIYILKSAGLLSLFYAGYFFLLKNDTTFKTNRIFLLAGIITSLFLPYLEITRTIKIESQVTTLFPENFSAEVFNIPAVKPEVIDWWQIAGVIYLLGLSFFLLKFVIDLYSLLKLIFTHKTFKNGDHYIIQKSGNTQPFSFFKYIVLDPAHHTPSELEMILRHERSHAHQWHSVDQLLTSLCVYLLWINPLAWLYRKSVIQNLEYLADKEVIATKVSRIEYQKTLLKISVGDFKSTLTNQFYQSFIKKRIMMLNKNVTQKSNFWKVSLLLPFLLLFIFSFNVKTEAMEVSSQEEKITSKVEVSAFVTKDSDEKTLRGYERIFVKQGVDLKFDNLQFSEGLLTRVTASFRKMSTGTSGNLTLTNANGIAPLLIYTDGEQVTMTPKTAVPKKPEGALQGIGNFPLFIIAGKEYNTSQLVDKYIEIKGDWSVLKPAEAEEQFGSKAKDGAIIISERNIIEDFKAALRDIDLKQIASNQTFIQVKRNETPMLISIKNEVNQKTTNSTTGKMELQDGEYQGEPEEIIAIQRDEAGTSAFTFQEEKPLIVVGGEVQDKDFDLNSIEPKTIKSLNVLKGESAIEKYGERAENGVIEIILKTEGEVLQENEKEQNQKSENRKEQNFTTESVSFKISEKHNKNVTEVKISNAHDAQLSKSDAIYVVDGKKMDKGFDPDNIDPSNIESIKVIKGSNALAKYGKKAGAGVIEITTKK